MDNTTNMSENFIREMLNSGKDIDTIMKEITDAANAVQEEGAQKDNLVEHYLAPINVEGDSFINRICTNSMTPEDFAIIMLHFYTQNNPDYLRCRLKNEDINAILDSFKKSIDRELRLCTEIMNVEGKSAEDILNLLFKEVKDALFDIIKFDKSKNEHKCGCKSIVDKQNKTMRDYLFYNLI